MPNAASGPGVSTHVRQYMLLGTYTTVCKRTFLRNTDAETPKQMLAGQAHYVHQLRSCAPSTHLETNRGPKEPGKLSSLGENRDEHISVPGVGLVDHGFTIVSLTIHLLGHTQKCEFS